jgi:hypothetical protein
VAQDRARGVALGQDREDAHRAAAGVTREDVDSEYAL